MVYSYTVAVPVYSTPYNSIRDAFISELIEVTSNALNIDSFRLFEKNKQSSPKYGRWIVWEILVIAKHFTLTEAAKVFGDYDHTTVVHGLDTLPYDLKTNEMLNVIYEGIIAKLGVSLDDILEGRNKRLAAKKIKAIKAQKA